MHTKKYAPTKLNNQKGGSMKQRILMFLFAAKIIVAIVYKVIVIYNICG